MAIHIWDYADILIPHEKDAIERRLRDLRFNTGKHISVVIVDRMDRATTMAGDDATLLVAMDDRKAVLVVGPSLQAALPTAFVVRIEALATPQTSNSGDTTGRIRIAVRDLADRLDQRAPARPDGLGLGDFASVGVLTLILGAIVVVSARRLLAMRRPTTSLGLEPLPRKPWRLPPAFVSITTVAIVVANLVPLAGVLFFGWRGSTLFVLFWLENVVIIALDALRVLFARPFDRKLWARKSFLVPGAIIIPGLFAWVHLLAIFGIFGGDFGRLPREVWTFAEMRDAIEHMSHIGLAFAGVALAQVFQFLSSYVGNGEYRLEPKWDRSFGRMVMLQVIVILGGMLAQAFGSPAWALFVLVVVRTAWQVLSSLEDAEQEDGVMRMR